MKFGFIGAGNVAQTYAKHFVRHGHEVVFRNSRGPDSLIEIARGIGPNARAGTVQEAAKQEIVILAVRWEQAKQALAEVSDWNGRILVDATNRPLDEDTKGKTASEVIAIYIPGARVVKALNDPPGDGQSKLNHVYQMLSHTVYYKHLPFQTVLMDTWYATKDLMLFIKSLTKIYYCPLKDNRQVDDSHTQSAYRRIDSLDWGTEELAHGKQLKIKGFPKDHKVQCFRVEVSTHRTDFVVTNDLAQDSTETAQKACGFRWKIEQLHREGKQVTGLEACQCRKARIQRNHIACAFLVWGRLKALATQTGQTIYQLKHRLLDDYLCSQLKDPSLKMTLLA